MSSSASSDIKVVVRPSVERGHAEHPGFLRTFHTWSFASYLDSKFTQFESLRVLNEDRVTAHQGFGTHGHKEFEIFSYIVSGELQHRDSMGNVEVMKRGDIQSTSAGTGITHSEMTHGDNEVHFLQMWVQPSQRGLKPAYYTRHFTDAEKRDTLLRVVAPAGSDGVSSERETSGPTPVNSPVTVWATILSQGKAVTHRVPKPSAKVYVHVIQTSGYNTGPASGATVEVNGTQLREGDGAFVYATKAGDELVINNVGASDAEFLVFDVE
ncbi:pirin domain-containing protein [Auriculariales sp. MPI-PUGE-AT-0066]|nr:pirin domain-containing protein [Auriculariales sp. MPI-PUGE-AT-0066]